MMRRFGRPSSHWSTDEDGSPLTRARAVARRLWQQFDRALERATCVGRLGEASDVAKLVAFLVSDDASYMTGRTLTLDGGMFAP